MPRQKVVLVRGVRRGGGTCGGFGLGEMKVSDGLGKSMGGGKGERAATQTHGRPGVANTPAHSMECWLLRATPPSHLAFLNRPWLNSCSCTGMVIT